MATTVSSSEPQKAEEKPLVVRVKRKASQSKLDALWLEINDRPFKRPLLDFGKLSISESSATTIVEELETRKVLLCHVETVTSSEVTFDVLQSVVPASADESKTGNKGKEIRRTFKTEDKHDQLLAKAKQSQEAASKNARFKQIWRSRKSKKEALHDEPLHDMCQFYDVVRVDVEEANQEALNEQKRNSELEDHKLMAQYLPLLKEILPSAAEEIESDIHDYASREAPLDGFVYDIYTVKDEMDISEEDVAQALPVVQVDAEDDYYEGPDESEYESDDSNAENNPLNDYPDEESSEESTEDSTEDNTSTEDQSEKECISSDDQAGGADRGHRGWSDDDNLYSDDHGDDNLYSDDHGDDEEYM